jgi:hypothetical protein
MELPLHTVRVVLQAGSGWTPLCFACAGSDVAIVQSLVELGASVNAPQVCRDSDVQAMLSHCVLYMMAVCAGNTHACRRWTAARPCTWRAASVTGRPRRSSFSTARTATPLTWWVHYLRAAHASNLAHPAVFSGVAQNGMTPLHFACAYGHKDVVAALMLHGVDVLMPTKVWASAAVCARDGCAVSVFVRACIRAGRCDGRADRSRQRARRHRRGSRDGAAAGRRSVATAHVAACRRR